MTEEKPKDGLIQMPTLEEFEKAGPVVQFLTKLLSNVVGELHEVEHRLQCMENGGCAWSPAESNRPDNSIMGEAAETLEGDEKFNALYDHN